MQFALILTVASTPVAMPAVLSMTMAVGAMALSKHKAIVTRLESIEEVVIFNRSHYEDVLVVRVHELAPKAVWRKRYERINQFERSLAEHGTRILKFFLHISPEEQLRRFRRRLEDPSRQWKISEADYAERPYWKDYQRAYEDVLARCSSEDAPWYIIPADHKWFRNLAVSRVVVEQLEALDMHLPEPRVDLDEIRRIYHRVEQKGGIEGGAAGQGL